MSGGFHIFFGFMLGLLIWIIVGKDGRKRWSLGLIFVFALNSHFGPDFVAVTRFLANLSQSEIFYKSSAAIHSYFGWVLFAPIWAVFWHAILGKIAQKQESRAAKQKSAEGAVIYKHTYAEVYIATLTGGFCHHFIDLIGHYRTVGGVPYVSGRFILLSPQDWVTAIVFGVVAGALYLGVLAYRARASNPNRTSIARQLNEIKTSPQTRIVAAFFCIGLLNTLFLYFVQFPSGEPILEARRYPWLPGAAGYEDIYFSLAVALRSTMTYPAGTATWYIATCIVVLIAGFIGLSAKSLTIPLRGRRVRADHLLVVGVLAAMLVGWLLQPFIGNTAGHEADLGLLPFIWGTLGTTLCGVATILYFPPKSPAGTCPEEAEPCEIPPK